MAEIKLIRADYRLIHGQVITKWVKEANANIIEVQYDRIQADLNLNETIIHVAVEVSSKEHGDALIKALKQKGYEITME